MYRTKTGPLLTVTARLTIQFIFIYIASIAIKLSLGVLQKLPDPLKSNSGMEKLPFNGKKPFAGQGSYGEPSRWPAGSEEGEGGRRDREERTVL